VPVSVYYQFNELFLIAANFIRLNSKLICWLIKQVKVEGMLSLAYASVCQKSGLVLDTAYMLINVMLIKKCKVNPRVNKNN